MKTPNALRIALAAILDFVSGAIGRVVNLSPAPYVLGAYPGTVPAAYPAINSVTIANLIAGDANAQEILWSKRVIMGAELCYQDNPLAEYFTARVEPGKKPNERELKKAIVSVTDAEKVHGQVINITTRAGLGGPGVPGEGTRTGYEQKQVLGSFAFRIGTFWFGTAWTQMARDQTMLGLQNDKYVSEGLRTLLAKKQSDDHMMRWIAWAQNTAITTGGATPGATTIGSRNNILPGGVSSVANLISSNTVDTVLITDAGDLLPSLGGIPMDTVSDSGGSVGEVFTFFSTDIALKGLKNDPAYFQGQASGGDRGPENPLFKGGLTKWDSHGLYRWIMKDHANQGPVGSPLNARAYLGQAVTSATTNTVLYGGGFVFNQSSWPVPNYFEFFAGAPYQFFNGDTIARNTNNTNYVLIILPVANAQGHYFNVLPYTTVGTTALGATAADIITLSGAPVSTGWAGEILSSDTSTTGSGNGFSYPQGSLIVQCNANGCPFGYSFMLGAQSLVCGNGSINGSASNPVMGKRTVEILNHGTSIAIGAEAVWGNQIVQRAGDGAAPGFLMATHALAVRGAPIVL